MAWRGLKRKSISVSNRRLNWGQAKCLQLSTTKKVFKERKTFNGSSMAFNDNNPTLHTGDITRWMKLGKKKVISYWSWQPKKEWVKSVYLPFNCCVLFYAGNSVAWMLCSYETKKCNCNCKYKVNLSAGLCLVAKPQLPLIKFQTKLRFLSSHAPDMRKCIDLPSVALTKKGKSWHDWKF